MLLAAGGFEGNAAMRREHGVPGDVAWTMAPRGTNTGEPIEAAVALGAATDFRPLGWFCPGLEQPDGGGSFTLGFRSGLMVDQSGRRYANECLPYDRFGREMAKAPERIPSWYVFDYREGGRLPAIAMPEGDPAAHLEAGTWVSADTIGELAAAAGLPGDALAETVARFNGFAEAGVDEDFRRGEDEYDTVLRRRHRVPEQGAHPGRRAAVLRRPLRALRPRHQGRPGHRRRRPRAARGRNPDPGAVRRRQHRGLGLRFGLPGPGRPARLGDGLRRARGGGHHRLRR